MLKKLLLAFFILLFNENISFSQKITIPEEVDSSFRITYSKALNSEWMQEGEKFSVTFRVSNGQSVHVIYDSLGNITEKYMALPSRNIPPEIIKYLRQRFQEVAVHNYWVKQKGLERIYKISLGSQMEGIGQISGTSYGSIDSLKQYENNTGNSVRLYDSTVYIPNYIYFDRFCNEVKSQDAMSEFFVAKPPAKVSKPIIAENSKPYVKKRFRK